MQNTDLNYVLTKFNLLLSGFSFKKKNLNWYINYEEIVVVFNLQKSQWGTQLYINIGVLFKGLENTTTLKKINVIFGLD